MQNLGYYNGVIKLLEELYIPATDRAVYFGDGVYEVAFAVNQKPFALDEHIDRFFNSCKLLQIKFKKSKNELKKIIMELLKMQKSFKQKIYWQASRSSGIRQHTYDKTLSPNLLITITNESIKNMETVKYDLISVEDTRFLHCNIKTLNLIPAVMASQKAQQQGAQEAVLHRNGFVTECAHSNISILKNGVLKTAPSNNLILPGVTRKHLIEICKDLKIPVLQKPFTLNELLDCDEAIISASGILLVAAKSIDNKPIGGKANTLLTKIQQAYKKKIIKQCGQSLY